MAIRLGRPLPDASRDLPERQCGNPSAAQSRRPFLFGLAPGGVYPPRPSPSARCALTAPFHPYRQTSRCVGGLLSVALSLGSPPPDVIRHRVSVEPGLSSPCGFPHCKRRPSSHLTLVSLYYRNGRLRKQLTVTRRHPIFSTNSTVPCSQRSVSGSETP